MREYIEGLVSIIIPTHNCSRFISEAIDSCLKQTYRNIEIIVIDDGSTDDTEEVLKEYINKGQIKYVYQECKERCAARNNGISQSRGEFIQLLDADDLLESTKIEIQVEYLRRNSDIFGVYCSSLYFIGGLNNITSRNFIGCSGNSVRDLFYFNLSAIHAMLTRRADIYFDEELNVFEDWDYWLRLALSGKKFGCIEKDLCYVRVHDTNTSKDRKRMLIGELTVLNKLDKYNIYEDIIQYRKFQVKYLLGDGSCWEHFRKAVILNKKNMFYTGRFIAKEVVKKILKINRDKYK